MMISSYRGSIGRKGGGKARINPTAFLDYSQSHEPMRALPYGTGELYKFSRESSRWLQVYDTDSGSLVWREIGANVVPITGFYYADLNANGSPYDANGNLIPVSLRKGYHRGPGATNSIPDSRDFSTANWTRASVTVSKDAVGFDGIANSATTVTDGVTFGVLKSDGIAIANDGATHIGIIWIKKVETETSNPTIEFRLEGGTWVREQQNLNRETGSLSATVTHDGSGEVFEDGDFWIVVLKLTNNSSGNTSAALLFWPDYNSDAGATAVIDQAEIRLNTSFYDGIPIVTTGSAVTTLSDDYTLAIANHNQEQGMALLTHTVPVDNSGSGIREIISLRNAQNLLYFGASDFRSFDGSTQLIGDSVTIGNSNEHDVAVRWNSATSSRSVITNGSAVDGAYDGSFDISAGEILICRTSTINIPQYIKSLRYYQRDRGTAWIQGQQT